MNAKKQKLKSPIFPEMNKNMYAIIYKKNYYIYVSLIANLYHTFFSFWSILRSTLISQEEQ